MDEQEMELGEALKIVRAELGERKKTERKTLARLLKGMDVSEVMDIMAFGEGKSYNRRILRFFRWFCKWIPICIMAMHWLGLYDFRGSKRDTLVLARGSVLCDAWAYFMMYILPMVIIVASRFFFLCWKYRIPFVYFVGVNAVHLCHASLVTTKDMVMGHFVIVAMVCMTYLYAFADEFMKTRLGRRIF